MTGVVLAIETSGPVGSVALARDGAVVARRFLPERGRHAGALPGAIAEVLRAAGLAPAQVEAVAVGAGPGSFTGVRVAGAAANGFAHALGRPVVPVSSLAAAVLTARVLPPDTGPWPAEGRPRLHTDGSVRVLFDARGDRVFTAVYEVSDAEVTVLEAPRFARLPELLEAIGAAAVCGDGVLRHAEGLRATGAQVLPPPAGAPTADGVIAALAHGLAGPPGPAGGWEPEYLRETGAVRARRQSDR